MACILMVRHRRHLNRYKALEGVGLKITGLYRYHRQQTDDPTSGGNDLTPCDFCESPIPIKGWGRQISVPSFNSYSHCFLVESVAQSYIPPPPSATIFFFYNCIMNLRICTQFTIFSWCKIKRFIAYQYKHMHFQNENISMLQLMEYAICAFQLEIKVND